MSTMTKLQEYSFEIIANVGEAKSYAFEALNAAKTGDIKLYDENIEKAEEMMNKAHKIQFDLLAQEAPNKLEDMQFSILVVHAQDHRMTTLSTIELIKELAQLYLKEQNSK